MKNRQKIQSEVEKTLSCLDGVKKATPNPYMYTRVKARLEKEQKGFWIRAFFFLNRPAIAVAAIVVAVMINTAVFFEFRSETAQENTDENEQVFASEYNLSSTTIYDATTDQR